jgi:Leucine-rich repeat (LRR) protein
LLLTFVSCGGKRNDVSHTYADGFPDANFRGAVLRWLNQTDTGSRTDISVISKNDISLMAMVTTMDITPWLGGIWPAPLELNQATQDATVHFKYHDTGDIQDMTGLHYFTALTYLNCSAHPLTLLDVSKNTALINLHCRYTFLTSLDVSKNTALTTLWCSGIGRYLTSLNVSDNKALTELRYDNNQLTSLNVSNNRDLTELLCHDNQLTSLNVTGCATLRYISCQNNYLLGSPQAITGLAALWGADYGGGELIFYPQRSRNTTSASGDATCVWLDATGVCMPDYELSQK